MKTVDFDYYLPEELIATQPTIQRDKSRLLAVQASQEQLMLTDLYFENILEFIQPNDLVIFNNSRVLKARLIGHKLTGGRIELLIERILTNNQFTAHIRSNKAINLGLTIVLPNDLSVTVIEKLDGLFKLTVNSPVNLFNYLEEFGTIPLPPYMHRTAMQTDNERYQTVYAKNFGSVAAPTAGLHFTPEIMHQIINKGAKIAYVTLHVGSGTFKPVNVENILEHKMHSEVYHVDDSTVKLIKATQERGGQIIAVGTTSLRTLETIANHGFKVGHGETDIFITPGYQFKIVDKLITNFHLPKSTLLMLVSAFTNIDTIRQAYQHAINHRYRFFSYGDAMLLTRESQ